MIIEIKLNIEEFMAVQILRRRINTNKSLYGTREEVINSLNFLDKIIKQGLKDDLIKYI